MKRWMALWFALGLSGFFASALLAAPAPGQPAHGPRMNSAHYALDWSALGEISGGPSTSAHYSLSGTVGQIGATTSSSSAHYAECSGFECAAQWLATYLPLIRR